MSAKNDRIIRALFRQPVDQTPVWIMRQAGRYLPEYRAARAKAGNFLTLCKTPELACEATLQPLRRFQLDAAIIFSDILTIPDAMGLGLYFTEGEGPRFQNPIRDRQAINCLPIIDPEIELRYVMDAIRLCHAELKQELPIIGFSGSPWTLATYMVEGGASKEFQVIKKLLYSEPKTLHLLLEKLSVVIIDYLNAQIKAGVEVVMLFDTWGGILTTQDYYQFSLHYLTKIIQGLHCQQNGKRIPVILFTKGSSQWLEKIAESGCDAVGIDWTIDINIARKRIGDKVALQGNLDPAALYASPENIRIEVASLLEKSGKGSGHIFNLGHGISQYVDPEHVRVLVDAVHELSRSYHI